MEQAMAGADGTRCRGCGKQIEQHRGRGRPRIYCTTCKASRTVRYIKAKPKPGRCQECGAGFIGRPGRGYCSATCRNRAKHRRGDKRRPITVACHGCGITCQRPGRSIAKGHYAGRYCSRACCFDALGRVAAETAALRRIAGRDGQIVEARRRAALVDAETAALRRIAKYVERPRLTRLPCSRCGTLAIGLLGYRRRCLPCMAEERKRGRRIAKAKRRAATRGREANAIDPIRVFMRDHWRCHLCGCKTPKELRGTYDPRAPELDHIVALADGGTHTWGNVACACRACNGAKSARSMGQLGLGFAA